MRPVRVDGRYRLLAEVGRGSSGVVYEAVDERLDRRVAVKVLAVGQAGTAADEEEVQRARRRMLHEARAAARFRHPHAVTVYEVGEDPPYLVMELVSGPTLHALVRRHGPLPVARVAAIGVRLAGCLDTAHRAGQVHRDVKPANVLLDGPEGVKLADFGIAGLPTAQQVTLWGNILGSPPYLSPELAAGGDPTPASDWWSLGATLYYAVEGSPPFGGPNALATLNSVRHDPPAPARHAGPLAPLLASMLSKDPARRPDGPAVLAALTGLADSARPGDAPVPAPEPAPEPAPPRSPGRRPGRAALATLATLVVLDIAAAAYLLTRHPGHHAAGQPARLSSPSRSPSTDASPVASPSPSAAPGPATLELRAGDGGSYVRAVRQDGTVLYQGVLTPGHVSVVQGTVVTVEFGNAPAVDVTLNGQDLGPPACHTDVCTVRYPSGEIIAPDGGGGR